MTRRTSPKRRAAARIPNPPIYHQIRDIDVDDRQSLRFIYKTTEEEGSQVSIQTYVKAPGVGPIDPRPNGSIVLPLEAANELKKVLNESIASFENRSPLYESRKRNSQEKYPLFADIDPRKVMMALADPSVRKIWDHQDPQWAIKTGLIYHGLQQKLATAVAKLETLIKQDESDESKYQEWAEENLWAFGNYYVGLDKCRTIPRRKIVDLPVRNIRGYIDIVELKTPQPKVLKRISRKHGDDIWCFTHEVTEAICQCVQYLSMYHNDGGHHPRATIVIGKSSRIPEELGALHSLNAHMHNVSVMTFDELLAQAKQSIESLNSHLAKPATKELSAIEEGAARH